MQTIATMVALPTFVVIATLTFNVLQNCLAIPFQNVPCSFQPKCNCYETENGSVRVSCYNVTEIPVFEDATELVAEVVIKGMWNNIPARAFSGLKRGKVRHLNLERITINDKWSIDKDAFVGLPTIDGFTLYVTGFDKIFPIPKAIRDIPKMEELYMDQFYDTAIPQNSFEGMKLKRLQVSGSPLKLRQIDIGAFNGLQHTLQQFNIWNPELLEALDLSAFEGFTKLNYILHNAYNFEQKKLPKLKICVSGNASKIGSQTEKFYLTICSQKLPVGLIDPNIYGLFGRKSPFSIYECGMGSLDCTQDLQWMYAAIKNGYDIELKELACETGEDVKEYVLKKYNGTVFEYKSGSRFGKCNRFIYIECFENTMIPRVSYILFLS